jgi:diadenosine tetraphosphate (Ap4A) HIT family hydrolase
MINFKLIINLNMAYDQQNIFAKIIRGEIPASKIYEDEFILAFHDISKASPTHILIIPKGEYQNYCDFVNNAKSEEIIYFFKKVAQLANQMGVDSQGFRLITNNGSDAHQTVKHFHVHLLAGKKLGPLLSSDNQLR